MAFSLVTLLYFQGFISYLFVFVPLAGRLGYGRFLIAGIMEKLIRTRSMRDFRFFGPSFGLGILVFLNFLNFLQIVLPDFDHIRLGGGYIINILVSVIFLHLQLLAGEVMHFGFRKILLVIIDTSFLSDVIFLQTVLLCFRIILLGFGPNENIYKNTPKQENNYNQINPQHIQSA